MPYADFSGREIVKALRKMDYQPVGRKGSHVQLRYENSDTGEVRNVTVPLTSADEISQDTYRSIAEQCGATDFDDWCDWIEDLS